ncbi:MAG: hypothetical protein ABI678_25070 [Kofleriaceae bacterium]
METPDDRLRCALEMYDGVCIMRENLRRRHPSASNDEIEAALDAEDGDGDGVVVPWPRPKR